MKKLISVILTVALVIILSVPALAVDYQLERPAWVTVDGQISDGEWGDPIYRGVTLAAAEKGAADGQLDAWWYDGNSDKYVNFDLYLTNNDDALFIGCVIHNITPDYKSQGQDLWKYQSFAFSFAPFTEGTAVPHTTFNDREYERYTGYRIAMLADGTCVCESSTQGMKARELFWGTDFEVVYDSDEQTMTYEVAVPLKPTYTDVDLTKGPHIAFSALIALNYADNYVSASKNGSNRFLVGTAAALKGGPDKFAHPGHCLSIMLNDLEIIAELDPDKPNEDESSVASSAPEVSVPDESPSQPEVIAPVTEKKGIDASTAVLIGAAAVGGTSIIVGAAAIAGASKKRKAAQAARGRGSDASGDNSGDRA